MSDQEYQDWVDQCLKEHGWYAHYVHDDNQSPTTFNSHTHGFPEKFGVDDMQIVAGVPIETAHGIFHAIAGMLLDGTFGPIAVDRKYTGWSAIEQACLSFHPAVECGRNVWRIILPDKQYRCLRSEIAQMDPPWDDQFERGLTEGDRL